MQPGATDPA